jgi:hypothetical protein
LAAQQYKFPKDLAEGTAVVAPKVSDRLEVRLQVSQQPDHFDIAVGLGLQPTARPHPVQVAVDVEFQQIRRRIPRAACHLRLNMGKRCRRKIQPIDKGIDEAHLIIGVDIIVYRLRQQQNLRSVVARDVGHARFYRATRRNGTAQHHFSHGLLE